MGDVAGQSFVHTHVTQTGASWRPQVLPSSMLLLADTCPDALVAALEAALDRARAVDRASQHRQARPATKCPST